MLKIGLVGVGGISGAHIPAWEDMPDAQLTALCDIRPERFAGHEDKHCYTSLDEMLEQEDLDILDICLPTYLHADTAIKAMNKGIHVLCEKPISLKKEDVQRVYDTAKKNNVRFMVAQVLRFWPEYVLLKEIYDTQKYGHLLSGSMTRLGPRPNWSWDNWMLDEKRSGLVPFDLHIHDLDFMVYAFGTPVNTVSRRIRRPEQDVIKVLYDFEDFTVSSEATWYAAPYPFAAEFRFQFEQAVVAMEKGTLTIYENTGSVITPNAPATEGATVINLPTTDAYGEEIRYFADCVRKGVQADRVQPEELESVIDILNSL